MHTENYTWHIVEGYFSRLCELEAGGSKNYMPIQRLILYLLSNGKMLSLPKDEIVRLVQKVSPIYPKAVENIIGDRKNLDTIDIPKWTNINDTPNIWNSLPQETKQAVINIKDEVVNLMEPVNA